MRTAKRSHPSRRLGELPDGTIVRAPAGERGWFYAHKWKDAMIVYGYVGDDELTLHAIVHLPVAFVLLFCGTSIFWPRFWKPRPEVVGTADPVAANSFRHVDVDLARRELVTWDTATGIATRPVTFDQLDGVLVGGSLPSEDIVERLLCFVDRRSWTRELRVDHRTWTVDRHGQPVLREAVAKAAKAKAAKGPMSLLEFSPDNPAFVEELVASTPNDALASIASVFESAPSVSEYLERDDGGRVILAAAIVAIALEPAIAEKLEADTYMMMISENIRGSVRSVLVVAAATAIRRVLGENSELASEFERCSPESGALVASIGARLSKTV